MTYNGEKDKHAREAHKQRFWTLHDKDEYECPDCGRGLDEVGQWELHHKDGDPQNGAASNLVALCHRCHRLRHRREKTKERLRELTGKEY